MSQDKAKIGEDSNLTPEEKEFQLRVSKSEDKVDVFSEIGSVNRHLMQRDDFEVEETRKDDEGKIVGVHGKLPIGVLKVQGTERNSSHIGRVVADR
jgi:hypothetical protein